MSIEMHFISFLDAAPGITKFTYLTVTLSEFQYGIRHQKISMVVVGLHRVKKFGDRFSHFDTISLTQGVIEDDERTLC